MNNVVEQCGEVTWTPNPECKLCLQNVAFLSILDQAFDLMMKPAAIGFSIWAWPPILKIPSSASSSMCSAICQWNYLFSLYDKVQASNYTWALPYISLVFSCLSLSFLWANRLVLHVWFWSFWSQCYEKICNVTRLGIIIFTGRFTDINLGSVWEVETWINMYETFCRSQITFIWGPL